MKTKVVFPLLMLSMLTSCIVYDPPKPTLEIRNNTDSAIYVYETCADSLEVANRLALFLVFHDDDSFAPGKKSDTIYSPYYRVNAYSSGDFVVNGRVEQPSVHCSDKILRLFFIKESILRTYSWEEICKHQLYEEKVALTEDELKQSDWKYTYRPDF